MKKKKEVYQDISLIRMLYHKKARETGIKLGKEFVQNVKRPCDLGYSPIDYLNHLWNRYQPHLDHWTVMLDLESYKKQLIIDLYKAYIGNCPCSSLVEQVSFNFQENFQSMSEFDCSSSCKTYRHQNSPDQNLG